MPQPTPRWVGDRGAAVNVSTRIVYQQWPWCYNVLGICVSIAYMNINEITGTKRSAGLYFFSGFPKPVVRSRITGPSDPQHGHGDVVIACLIAAVLGGTSQQGIGDVVGRPVSLTIPHDLPQGVTTEQITFG
jgi:hypothetical protein